MVLRFEGEEEVAMQDEGGDWGVGCKEGTTIRKPKGGNLRRDKKKKKKKKKKKNSVLVSTLSFRLL